MINLNINSVEKTEPTVDSINHADKKGFIVFENGQKLAVDFLDWFEITSEQYQYNELCCLCKIPNGKKIVFSEKDINFLAFDNTGPFYI